jgi:hypothetical protein
MLTAAPDLVGRPPPRSPLRLAAVGPLPTIGPLAAIGPLPTVADRARGCRDAGFVTAVATARNGSRIPSRSSRRRATVATR